MVTSRTGFGGRHLHTYQCQPRVQGREIFLAQTPNPARTPVKGFWARKDRSWNTTSLAVYVLKWRESLVFFFCCMDGQNGTKGSEWMEKRGTKTKEMAGAAGCAICVLWVSTARCWERSPVHPERVAGVVVVVRSEF